jgi:TPR repeat protein
MTPSIVDQFFWLIEKGLSAEQVFQYLSNQGHDITALQYNVAIAYLTGRGVNQSVQDAFRWCKAAADQGLPDAICLLGRMYLDGIGVPQSAIEAHNLFGKAAVAGHPESCYNLAVIHYQEGNHKEAHRLFTIAARANYHDAFFNLAIMYENGEGVERSIEKAIYWYHKAWENGDRESRRALDRLGYPPDLPWLRRKDE